MSGCSGNSYVEGQGIRLTGQFRDDVGRLADPNGIYVRIRTPDSVVVTYVYLTDSELVRLSTGVYYIDLDLEQDGCWAFAWGSTGALQALTDGTFDVRAPIT